MAGREGAGRELHNVSLVCVLSDLHFGKTTAHGFDIEAAQKRIGQWAKMLGEHPGLPSFDDIVVILAGDIVDGGGIYPTHNAVNTHAVIAQADVAARCLWRAMTALVARFRHRTTKLRVVCVPGNHGRTSRDAHPHDNWDTVVYNLMAEKAQASQVSRMDITIEVCYDWTEVIEVRGHRIMIDHKGVKHVSTAAGQAKFLAHMRHHGADIMVHGHYHHAEIQPIMDCYRVGNGSLSGVDGYGASLGLYDPPRQVFFALADKRHGCANVKAANWVEWYGDEPSEEEHEDHDRLLEP